ncbi:MAG: head GIN domain-containing protein [Chitinophagaceae bacterium]
MKIINVQVVAALLVTFSFSGCQLISGSWISGDHISQKETRQIGAFSQLDVAAPVQVNLSQGEVTDAVLVGESNILPYLQTRLDNNRLVIKFRNGMDFQIHQPIQIDLTTPDPSQINLAGSGSVIALQPLTDRGIFQLTMAGSGEIRVQLICPEVKVHITGSGNISASGQTREERINVLGSGNFKGSNLKAEQVKASIEGSGNAFVFASLGLHSQIMGSGNIYYFGNPAIDTRIMGSGQVIKNH